ncbi:hypothetical protein LOK49_LG03G00762 [Camellia lanceoleosa]|uniref:Uncharacterized protein n=1 Tax=Camellia lanceoleosa TaxID=1840588 RepID=A0ACC0IB72_9ERIC|nr:hypothetical protein LOK49_LG03G00762 [Camellia lanceoleosa]
MRGERLEMEVQEESEQKVTVFPKKPLDGAHEIQSFCLGHTETSLLCQSITEGLPWRDLLSCFVSLFR